MSAANQQDARALLLGDRVESSLDALVKDIVHQDGGTTIQEVLRDGQADTGTASSDEDRSIPRPDLAAAGRLSWRKRVAWDWHAWGQHPQMRGDCRFLVGDTGIEPVTSSV